MTSTARLHSLATSHYPLSENLIIRYSGSMKTMTATEASRYFKRLLDAVEAGESFEITRGGSVIAHIEPPPPPSGTALARALADVELPALDDDTYREWMAALSSARTSSNARVEGLWGKD